MLGSLGIGKDLKFSSSEDYEEVKKMEHAVAVKLRVVFDKDNDLSLTSLLNKYVNSSDHMRMAHKRCLPFLFQFMIPIMEIFADVSACCRTRKWNTLARSWGTIIGLMPLDYFQKLHSIAVLQLDWLKEELNTKVHQSRGKDSFLADVAGSFLHAPLDSSHKAYLEGFDIVNFRLHERPKLLVESITKLNTQEFMPKQATGSYDRAFVSLRLLQDANSKYLVAIADFVEQMKDREMDVEEPQRLLVECEGFDEALMDLHQYLAVGKPFSPSAFDDLHKLQQAFRSDAYIVSRYLGGISDGAPWTTSKYSISWERLNHSIPVFAFPDRWEYLHDAFYSHMVEFRKFLRVIVSVSLTLKVFLLI